ncbi:hypothetical protein [Nesterenkonia pannonica]|uniref:hypothetical protein n=1 Tax=Nesterenkonia pannonica TaxID=1548602 RepID=UPI002164234A|nr:hypothetical protein [Nesterenkonia pannonica]
MRAGDVYRPGWAPALEASLFGSAQTTKLRWSRRMTVEEMVGYAQTLSSWLSADEGERERRRRNLSDYLQGELGLGDDTAVQVPMITAVHVAPVHRLQYS